MHELPFRYRRKYAYPEADDFPSERMRVGDKFVGHTPCNLCGHYRERLLVVVMAGQGAPVLEWSDWGGHHVCGGW